VCALELNCRLAGATIDRLGLELVLAKFEGVVAAGGA
jgi:hypothetical protein